MTSQVLLVGGQMESPVFAHLTIDSVHNERNNLDVKPKSKTDKKEECQWLNAKISSRENK